jgi:hypothetical protein
VAETLFEFVSAKLEETTDLDKLEARGTVRLGLKAAGLDPRNVSVQQMEVMLQKVLPGELSTRGVGQPQSVCEGLMSALAGYSTGGGEADAESPEDVFSRLGS